VSTGSAYAVCNLSSSLSEFWLRFAFRFNHYGDVTQVCSIASWALSGSLLGSVRINLLNGALSLFSSSTSLATGTAMLAPNKWLEIIGKQWHR
jgi:hypothetical protein